MLQQSYNYMCLAAAVMAAAACSKKIEFVKPAGQQYASEEICCGTYGDMYDYLIAERKKTESRITNDLVFSKLMKTMYNETNPKCKFLPGDFEIAYMKISDTPEYVGEKEIWKEKWAFDVCTKRYVKQLTFTAMPDKPLQYEIKNIPG
ncbi:MAG: hypothetical protein EB060_08310 [Proteobacteria bacterium]|nr:hypothetical protein [Pseudomonadota bacterium]